MSEPWLKCPLCETIMVVQEEHDNKWRVSQYEHKCPKGCYIEKYIYGSYKVVIGKHTWDRESVNVDKIQSEIQDIVATYIIRVNSKKENEYRKELGIE